MAMRLATIIRENVGLPNEHLLPDDAFETIMLGRSGDALDEVECMMNIGYLFDVSLSEEEYQRIGKMTFGEVVDFLMSLPRGHRKEIPRIFPGELEAEPCPTSWVFWEIRKFARKSLETATERVRPDARVEELFPRQSRL